MVAYYLHVVNTCVPEIVHIARHAAKLGWARVKSEFLLSPHLTHFGHLHWAVVPWFAVVESLQYLEEYSVL